MTAHQTRDAVAIAMRAYDHAIRLGHRHFGAEHFLLALAAADQPAGAVLRESVWSRRSPRPRAGASRDGVFLPHDAGGLQGIGNARREAESRNAPLIDVEDLALGSASPPRHFLLLSGDSWPGNAKQRTVPWDDFELRIGRLARASMTRRTGRAARAAAGW